MNYKVYIGDSNCTACGKKHKKVFEIDGKPYGSSCAKDILGKELSAPIWLYNVADEYIQKSGIEKNWINEMYNDDFEVNFWNRDDLELSWSSMGSGLFEKPVKIKGKTVKVDWQYEISEYIQNRHIELGGKERG